MFLVTGARYLLYRAHQGTNPPDAEARRWARRFVSGAGAAGLVWGIAGSALFPESSLPHQFLVIFLIGGMLLAAMVVLAPVRAAYLAYALPAFTLLIATVFAQGTTLHIFMGVLIVVFLGVVLGTSPMLNQIVRESLRVKFENSALVEQLSQANRELSERFGAQQKAEEVLRQTSQKFEALIEASPISIVARDTDLRIVKWNAAAERMFGWKEEEVLGQVMPVVPADREEETMEMRRQLQRGEPVADFETIRLHKDGRRIDVSISTTIMRDAAGTPTGFISLATDISERKRTERRLQMEHAVCCKTR